MSLRPAPSPPAAREGPRYAPESRAALDAIPGRPVANSTDAGWTSLLFGVHEKRAPAVPEDAHFETPCTSDESLVVAVRGDYQIAYFRGGVWRRGAKQAGSGSLLPAGQTDRLRWHSPGGVPIRTAHLYLPSAFLDEAREHFRRAGATHRSELLPTVGFRDPVVAHAMIALLRAAEEGAPDLYAESVAQHLATHLLSAHSTWADGGGARGAPAPLTDRRLARALDYMAAHFGEPLTLEQIAAEAGVSKFHFVRLFHAAAGETPHEHLVGLRLRAARRLLCDTDLSVAEVGAACGYTSASHFGRAFARREGRTPTAHRAAARAVGSGR